MPPAPTVTQIRSLYNATLSTASRFTSYNYHNYFVWHTHNAFKPLLAALDPAPGSTPLPQPDPNTLAKFFEEQSNELEVLKRAVEVNRAFAGPKLVVEHPRLITSGGGAGSEASVGGGGQPVNPDEKLNG